MVEQSQEPTDFQMQSFLLFCLDENGDINLDMSWGNSVDEVRNFSMLLSKIVNNELTKVILEHLKKTSETQPHGKKKYSIVEQMTTKKQDDDLAISPIEVEIV